MPGNHSEKQKKLILYQNIALTGYFSLFLILMLNIIWLIPSAHFPTALVLLVIVSPLLFPLRGLLNSKTYTFQWASFLSLAYFAHGITEISAHPQHWYAGLLETLAAVVMYLGCILYARVFKQEKKKLLKQQGDKSQKNSIDKP